MLETALKMPQHRRSEILPQRLLDKVRSSPRHVALGHVCAVRGGGLMGGRCGFLKPKLHNGLKANLGSPIDIQYALRDNILARTEFLRGDPAIPVHLALFDPETGQRFSTVIDCY